MKKILAVICASPDQIPIVNKAKEMGIETHCFAWDKEYYSACKGIADYFHPISILEKEEILEVCKEIKIDGVTSNDDYAIPTVAYVAQNMGLTGNNYEDMLMASNKFTMRQALYQNGVNSPRFTLASESVDLTNFKYPLIVKPVDRALSIGVIKVEREEDLQEAVQKAINLSHCKEAIIEEFISGLDIEASVDAVSYNGKHYITAIGDIEFAKTEDLFLLLGKHYPSHFSPEILNRVKTETLKALKAINFKNGVSNTQFKITETGEVFSIEISPRPSFVTANHKINIGSDLIKALIDIAMGQFEEPVFTNDKIYSGLVYLCKETEWARQVIENKECDPNIVEAEFYENGDDEYGGRSGYFVYQSKQKTNYNQFISSEK